MSKRKRAMPITPNRIDIETYDCGELASYVQKGISEKRQPAESDRAEVQRYTSTQICVQMNRLIRDEKAGRLKSHSILHKWEDCLGYTLLAREVSEKAAEYNCPKKQWLSANIQ